MAACVQVRGDKLATNITVVPNEKVHPLSFGEHPQQRRVGCEGGFLVEELLHA
jgi:hypothetical protein